MDSFQQAINETILKISKQRDEAILLALEQHGHKFETREDLVDFIEHHCEIHGYGQKKKLIVDGLVILEWWDTFDTEFRDGKLTFTAGKNPE